MASAYHRSAVSQDLRELVAASGLRRVHLVSWRDLDDDEAGGSEVHASNVMKRWVDAGLDVTLRTSFSVGRPQVAVRDGFNVVRRGGRYGVFPRAAISEALRRTGSWDAFVEIWNGMPFFSPLWTLGKPSTVWLHHMHADMWHQTFASRPMIGKAGFALETRIAPKLYRTKRIVTLSDSSKHELVHEMGFRADRVDVVPPGIDARFSPGGEKSPHPLVVAVGRLVPVKRYDYLIRVLAEVKRAHPTLEAIIASEGYERPMLEQLRHDLGADEWIHLPGFLSDDAVVDLYRRAWVLASTSLREGWHMGITEAAACGTPAIATDIAGHRDALAVGRSGLLARDEADFVQQLTRVLGDGTLRAELTAGALERAGELTWDATAYGTFRALADEAARRSSRRR
jgi:glycosyltransferase involved in cell wall biosynthesis